jgi:AcrR family transcriptional regulator
MELYRERGYDHTTVADIAARAGLTERTFFRYFADKREVLFWGAGRLEEFLRGRVTGAAGSASAMDAVAGALEATSSFFEERRELARTRHALISTHPDLKERELIKLASLAVAIGESLHERGVPAPASHLAAETGVAIFKIAFERWVNDAKKRDFAHHVRESLGALKAITAGGGAKATPPATARTQRASSVGRTTARRAKVTSRR